MPGRFEPLEIARRWAARAPCRWLFFAGLALAATWSALGQVGELNDFRDSHLLHSYEVAAVRTVIDYGQAPLWNPWACGGLYAVGNPQTRFASPTFLVSLLFGARRAEALLAFLFLFLGMEGAFRFLKLRTGSALGPLLAAPAFGLNGFFAVSWVLGWAYFYGFALLPWILFGVAQWVRGRAEGLLLVAGTFSVMIGFGGTYAVPLSGLFALAEAGRGLSQLQTSQARKQALVRLFAAGCLIVGACLFRLWPILETMHTSPRIMAGAPRNSLIGLSNSLFELPSMGGAQFFTGPAIAVLALAGCLTRRAVFPVAVVLISGWLALGYTSPSLFAALREVAIFKLLRYPERFLLPGSLFLAELAALGLNAVLLRSRRSSGWRWAALALSCIGLLGALSQAYASDSRSRLVSLVPEIERRDQPFAQARGNRWSQGYFLEMNRGSISCGEGYPVRMSRALRGDLRAEEFLEDERAGTARRVAWSPNRIEVDVDTAAPTHLIVNQNWHPAWRVDHGEVISRDGLLAVRLPQGKQRVVLRFVPRSAICGAAVSVLALAIAAWLAIRQRRRGMKPAQLIAAAIVPLMLGGVLAASWREALPEPILSNPDGSPILVAEPAQGAQRVAGSFGLPISLEAVRVADPDAEGIVAGELYWRINGPLPRSLGIFIHFDGPGGAFRVADHEVIAGTYLLSNAPRQVLLRDSFAARLQPGTAAGEWTMWVGLWHASGDGTRVPAFAAGGRPAQDDRLEVARFSAGSHASGEAR